MRRGDRDVRSNNFTTTSVNVLNSGGWNFAGATKIRLEVSAKIPATDSIM